MYIANKIIVIVFGTILLVACSDNNEMEEASQQAFSNEGDDAVLAQTLYCAGASDVLSLTQSEIYPDIEQWSDTFSKISANAMSQISDMELQDGAAVNTRLSIIKAQTSQALNNYENEKNKAKFGEFVQQTAGKCANYAS